LMKPSSVSAAQGHPHFARGIITGEGFGSDPMAVEVTFMDKHGGFYTFEQVQLLSDDKIAFDLGAEPCNLTRGRFRVMIDGKPSNLQAPFLPPQANPSPGAAAAASAASQASRKRKGASRDQEQAASASRSSTGSEDDGSSSGSESDGSSRSTRASSPDEGAGSAVTQPAKKPRRYPASFKQAAMEAYREAKDRGDATVTMNDVAISFGVPRRTLSNWLAAAGMQARWPTRTYSPEEKVAALSKYREQRGLGYSQVEAAQSAGVPLTSLRNWNLGRDMDQKAYSMAAKAAYQKGIGEALAGGASLESIAEELGLPSTTVRTWAMKGSPRATERASSVGAAAAAAGVAPKLP
jgi:transposase-like protein